MDFKSKIILPDIQRINSKLETFYRVKLGN